MTKKPNKENKPKLFEDYANEVLGLIIAGKLEVDSGDQVGEAAMISMLNNLATQIHELNEKVNNLTNKP